MSKKVALQCGHGKSTDGSWDCGTSYGGNNEAALMLPITKAAVKYLRSYGVTVISDSDTGNNKNMIVDVAWANKEKCDIYVSVHCDYYKAPSGVMPLYVSTNGKKLAAALNNAVKQDVGIKSRGVVRRTDLWELNGTDMPACILETGSIKADISVLKNKADAYGKAIAKGICDYLGVKIPTVTTPTKTTTKELYRVRKSWNEPATQKGAFQNLEGAKQCADVNGLNVYASNGKLVYSAKKKVASTPSKRSKIASTAKSYCGAKSKPTAKYKSAAKSVYGTGNNTNCHRFVGTVLYKCGYPKMPIGGSTKTAWKNILAYLNKNATLVKAAAKDDIVVWWKGGVHYHIFIVTGGGKKAEAAHGKSYPHLAKYNPNAKYKKVWIYRMK